MGAEKDIIVAVELGSTAIRGIAGKREPDGTMRILAISQEETKSERGHSSVLRLRQSGI